MGEKLQLKSSMSKLFFQTNNKSLMKYVIEYTEIMKLDSNILYHLNYIRIKKEIYLPCELVGFEGNIKTSCFSNINEKSSIY